MDFPYIDPVIVSIPVPFFGELALRWYGLMYLLGFLAAWWLGVRRARQPGSGWTEEQVGDFLFYGFLGVILGGRFGYVIFYNFDRFMADPIYLLRIWEGGMSFHGGLLGVLVAFAWFARRHQKKFFDVADYWAPMAPIGLGLGRLGNFINGELYGRPVDNADLPWAMRFACNPEQAPWYQACDPEALLRHPSQLYQMMLEGVLLFIILWWFSSKPRPRMAVSGLFALGYGSFRFFVEQYRQPDEHLGLLSLGLSMGQWLSIPLILLGLILLFLAYGRGKRPASVEN